MYLFCQYGIEIYDTDKQAYVIDVTFWDGIACWR